MIWLAHWGGRSLERRVGEHSATVGQRAGARLGHGGVAGLAVEVDGEGVETRGEVGQVGRRVGRGVVAVELGRPGVRGAVIPRFYSFHQDSFPSILLAGIPLFCLLF